ncbi:hypothetical protein [Mannheimia haemolytica]|uniref:hypothetical protein n=1 Tax=Mannheimia haemolytica TaxID=75985 RepID=UPI001EFF3CE2|nr:hypothetical protein [Mannheimia haemolytica]
MSIVIVDTDFVVHKEDEEWTTEEIKMIEEHLLEEQSAQYQVKREVPKQFYADIAERLSRGRFNCLGAVRWLVLILKIIY